MIKETVFKSFDTTAALEQQLAERIAQQLQQAVDSRGEASLVVSGGSTPLKLFRALSDIAIDWRDVYITLADERWVEPYDKDSNESLVRANLLQGHAACAKFRGLKNMFATPEAGLQMACESLANLPRPFDVVVLGMGNDGHTCSWFPCAPADELNHALNSDALLAAVQPQSAPHARITLTRNAILGSRQIYLHLVGEQKLAVYRQALADDDIYAMPIRAVLAQHKTPVDVYWSA
ncbi:6-phosphogluconolactonase [Shewanella sp. NFH-SH190041]|uniref:6-phosphogluconolactonase n=1 Tax=Shewanella sp. NFH-SH190041 TaxID=2950245 RepID=UPI0021C2AAA0|nr:6-phosphogluconolactonase [Shewanella sp. NFH-SH190041]BDM64489.1 6-phosphogluconolactonase [Shewanella sp. NFH-SH190041]